MAEKFERRRLGKAQIVEVGREAQFGQQVEIAAYAGEHDPGIKKIRLPLALGRAQIGEDAMRPSTRPGQIEPAKMPVAIHPDIIDVIIEPAIVANLRRTHEKAILIVVEFAAFAVVVAQIDQLRGKALDRKILAEYVRDQD